MPRIALASLLTECNNFGGRPTDLERFRQYELRFGENVFEQREGVVGGMLAALEKAGAEVVPLISASTCPGGPVTWDCYRVLKGELLRRLREAGPVDGVLLGLHGAAVVESPMEGFDTPALIEMAKQGADYVEGSGDLEGDLLRSVREVVGPRVPIVATLDLHGYVTQAMVSHADALVAWETYPHKDAYTTGERGAHLLLATAAGRVRPTMAAALVPVLTGGCLGHTEGPGPFADLMRMAKQLEKQDGVLSANVFLVHPYLDQPDMGSGAVIVTDDDPATAERLATELAALYWERRAELEPPTFTPAEGIERGLAIEGGPVLLVEAADCAGGGATGDSVATLRALLATPIPGPAYAMVVDPEAAAECVRRGVGGEYRGPLGHRLDPQWGTPLDVAGTIRLITDGRFQYTGGIWAGTWASMGPTALLEIGPVQVLVMSQATYDWADEQYRSAGLDPAAAKFIVVKNPMNYRWGYAGVSKAAFILDTPGPTPPTVKSLTFRRLQRPYFPADADIPGLTPRVLRGRG